MNDLEVFQRQGGEADRLLGLCGQRGEAGQDERESGQAGQWVAISGHLGSRNGVAGLS